MNSQNNPTIPNWLDSIHAYIESDLVTGLVGKFHAHLTIELENNQAEHERLSSHCKQHKIKLTVVDIENSSGQSQTDVMTTTYYRDHEQGAVARIANQLAQITNDLQGDGFKVIRAKLEHESLPSLPTFSKANYHEVHAKLEIPGDLYPQTHTKLVEIGKTAGFVPSRNPLDQKGDQVIQFINQRIYNGTHEQADKFVSGMLKSVEKLPVSVIEVKRETVVFDTLQQLDSWWL